MIAVDTNLLVYWHREDSPFHEAAKKVLEPLREARERWAIAWPCIHEFIGIVTHPKIYFQPTKLSVAFATVESWKAGGNVELLAETGGYWEKLRQVSESAKVEGARIHDARIAALCLHHGVRELWSCDRDFRAFARLTIRNPLVRG